MSNESERSEATPLIQSSGRRQALRCLGGWAGAAVVWTLAGGVRRTLGATTSGTSAAASKHAFTFVQISDTHIGYSTKIPTRM